MRFSFKKIPEFLGSLFSLGCEAGMCHCGAAGAFVRGEPTESEASTGKSGARDDLRLGPPFTP